MKLTGNINTELLERRRVRFRRLLMALLFFGMMTAIGLIQVVFFWNELN